MIKSKRHPLIYLVVSIITLLTCVAVFSAYLSFDDMIENGHKELKDYLSPFILISILTFFGYTIKQLFKNSPSITIDNENIKFGGLSYKLSDIVNISFTGKRQYPFLLNSTKESAKIEFKDETSVVLFDDSYINTWKIKSFLEKVVVEGKEYNYKKIEKIRLNSLNFEKTNVFKGNQFTSGRGMLIWIPILFFLFLVVPSKKVDSLFQLLFVFILDSFWFFFGSWMIYYVCLTKDYLIIQNPNLPWIEKVYRLDNIKEVIIEQPPSNLPHCIRIITNDYRNKYFPAGTLRKKHWIDLIENLENKGIKVRNECIKIKNVA